MQKDREGWVPVEQAAAITKATVAELRSLSRRNLIPKIEGGKLPVVAFVQAYTQHLRSPVVTIPMAAERIGLSTQMVLNVISAGYIDRVAGGVVLDDALLGYARWLRGEGRRSSRSGAESGLKAARQREIELRIAERESRLVDTEMVITFVNGVVGAVRAELEGLPARVAREMPLRGKVEGEVNGSLQRISEVYERHAASLREHGTIDDADGSADA